MNATNHYKKYSEILSYLIFGGLTTAVSMASYYICNTKWGVHYLIANVISWVLAVLFAYITNKCFVFHAKERSLAGLKRELQLFFGARLLSLGMEEIGLLLLVSGLDWGENPAKFLMQGIVIAMNYGFSKWVIFKK